MTQEAPEQTAHAFRRVLVERGEATEPPLPAALAAVVEVLAEWRPSERLRCLGDPPRPSALTEQTLGTYLSSVRRARDRYVPEIFRLADDAERPRLAVFLNLEETRAGAEEASLWFSLPSDLSGPAFEVGRLMELTTNVCRAFGAYRGAVEDERLMALYRGRRAAERAREQLPPELRQFVPEAPTDAKLPSLLVPQEFDRRRVPDAVWWVNFWDDVQARAVSPARIRAADWARAEELAGGAWALAATEEPTDASDPAHVERLRRIVEALGLYELQAEHRVGG